MCDLFCVPSNVWFAVVMFGFLGVGLYALDTWQKLQDREKEG